VSHFIYYYAECHYAECHYAECHYAECHYAECHYAECHYALCHYAECHYAECRYPEYRYTECHNAKQAWVAIAVVTDAKSGFCLARGGSTVVEYQPDHPKAKGLSPASTAEIGLEKMGGVELGKSSC
jgi:hypothetical protein